MSAEHEDNQNLRDRIAAALRRMTWPDASGDYPITYEGMADAVIDALNLRTDQVGTLTRYVTEWIDNG